MSEGHHVVRAEGYVCTCMWCWRFVVEMHISLSRLDVFRLFKEFYCSRGKQHGHHSPKKEHLGLITKPVKSSTHICGAMPEPL